MTKVSVICHGNIARSQILHHYLAHYADEASIRLDLFSCGTAPVDAFPDVERMLSDVRSELKRRGLNVTVERNTLDEEARQRLEGSDLILVADSERKGEVLSRFANRIDPERIRLFYEFIGEGQRDFVDTYDADSSAQDPVRFARCFDELERIARLAVDQIGRVRTQPPR